MFQLSLRVNLPPGRSLPSMKRGLFIGSCTPFFKLSTKAYRVAPDYISDSRIHILGGPIGANLTVVLRGRGGDEKEVCFSTYFYGICIDSAGALACPSGIPCNVTPSPSSELDLHPSIGRLIHPLPNMQCSPRLV